MGQMRFPKMFIRHDLILSDILIILFISSGSDIKYLIQCPLYGEGLVSFLQVALLTQARKIEYENVGGVI